MQEEGNQDLRDTGKVGFGTVGIHYWRIQETRDTGNKGYMKQGIHERRITGNEGYRKRGIQETRNQDKEEWKQKKCRTGGIQITQCKTAEMQNSWDAGQLGCRTGGMKD